MSAPVPDGISALIDLAKAAVAHAGPGPVPADEAAALERICREHAGLIRYFARNRRVPPGRDRRDLVQIGWLGLLRLIRRFDAGRGSTIATASGYAIQGELQTDDLDATWPVRVPRYVVGQHKRARRGLSHRPYDAEAVGAALGRAEPAEIVRAFENLVGREPDPAVAAEAADRSACVAAVVARLPDLDREFVVRRFGLGGREPETTAAIAASWGAAEYQVFYVQRRAMRLLRGRLLRVLGEEVWS